MYVGAMLEILKSPLVITILDFCLYMLTVHDTKNFVGDYSVLTRL